MRFTVTGIVKVTAEYEPGSSKSKHIATDFRLEVSKNLKRDEYLDRRELPTKAGSHALTNAFVQGLIGNIHYAHQKGFRDSAEHLRYIIGLLEDGFVAIAETGEGEM